MHVEQAANPRALPTRPVIPVVEEEQATGGEGRGGGDGEGGEGDGAEGVRPHQADGSILFQDRGNSRPVRDLANPPLPPASPLLGSQPNTSGHRLEAACSARQTLKGFRIN